ncbi:MAG: O-antigen ligase [Kiritimatiellia bacterium]|jgi:O-antigen ligase
MRHDKQRTGTFRTIFSYGILAICLIWSTLPFGGVAPWAKASIIILNLLGSGCILTLFRLPLANDTLPWYRQPIIFWYALLLLGSCYLVPLPASIHQLMHSTYSAREAFQGNWPLAIHPAESRMTLAYWISLTALAAAVFRLAANRRQIFILVCLLLLLGLFQTLNGLLGARIGLLPDNPFMRWRLTSTFSSSNSFGGLLAILIPVTAGTLLYQIHLFLRLKPPRINGLFHLDKRAQREMLISVAVGTLFLLEVFALLLSASRGAILSVIVALALLSAFAIYQPPNRISRKKMALGLGICLLLGLGLTSGGFKVFLQRMPQLDSLEEDVSLGGRKDIWEASLKLAKAHPAGVGPGCYKDAIPTWQPSGFGPSRLNKAHNDYLQLVCETGWLGGGLFAAFILGCGLYLGKAFTRINHPFRWLYAASTLGAAAAAIHAAIDFNLSSRPGVGVPFAIVLGAAFAGRRLIGAEGYTPQKLRPGSVGKRRIWLIPMWLGVLVITGDLFRQAASYWSLETAWVRAGGQVDPYFWLPGKIKEDGSVDQALESAKAWAGNDPHVLPTIYRTKALELEQTRQSYVAELYAQQPNFSLTRVDRMADQAIAPERITLAEANASILDQAFTRLPFNLEHRMTLAAIRVQEVVIAEDDQGERVQRAMAALAEAETSAPNDAQLLTAIAPEWSRLVQMIESESDRSHAIANLKRVCFRAFESATVDPRAVALAWHHAGLDLSELTPAFPITHFMEVYKDFQSEWTTAQTRAFMDTWQARLTQNTQWRKRFQTLDRYQDYQSRYLTFTHRERIRLLIRTLNLDELKTYQQQFRAHREQEITRTLESLGDLDSRARLFLEDSYETQGLNFDHTLRLAILTANRNGFAAVNEMIADAVLRHIRTDQHIGAFPLYTEELPRDEIPAAHLLDGLAFYQAGEQGKAMTAIQHAIEGMRTRQFKPGAYYFSMLNHDAQAEDINVWATLEQVAWGLANDPELEPLGRAAGLIPEDAPAPDFTPEIPLGILHGGRSMELLGITPRPPSHPNDPYVHVTLYFRFWRTIPADLEVQAFVQYARSTEASHREHLHLAKVNPLYFNEGAPLAGSIYVWHTRIPRRKIEPGSTFCVGFRQSYAKKWIPTTDGIPYIVIDDAPGLFK